MSYQRWMASQNALRAFRAKKANGTWPLGKTKENAITTLFFTKTNYFEYHKASSPLLEATTSQLPSTQKAAYSKMVLWLRRDEAALDDLVVWEGVSKAKDGYSLDKLKEWLAVVNQKVVKQAKKSHKKKGAAM